MSDDCHDSDSFRLPDHKPSNRTPKTLFVLSLGCPKNRVDSEWITSMLADRGLSLVSNADEADVVLINTCAFIEPAIEESLDATLEAIALKAEDPAKKVVVAGCLPQRFGRDLADSLPEVDLLVGCSRLGDVADLITGPNRIGYRPAESRPAESRLAWSDEPSFLPQGFIHRRPSQWSHQAYVKVSEGCNRQCAFCTVPSIRGRLRSRPISDIADEIRWLVSRGVREVTLVSQDLTAYGRDRPDRLDRQDLPDRPDLAALVEQLSSIEGLLWLRTMYLYPSAVTKRLIERLRPHCVPYLDLPIQHVSDRVLKMMGRGYGSATVHRLMERIEDLWPEASIRATLLVGHPGETKRDFEELKRFVAEAHIDHLGVFPFFPEEGTKSARQHPRPRRSTAQARRDELMALAQDLSRTRLAALVGTTMEVLVDGQSGEFDHVFVGRHAGQAPDVDGVVYVTGDLRDEQGVAQLQSGDLVTIRVEQSGDYDLAGPVVAGNG
ncbi:MAG: 30S ribosomal protein S12 methylthiotransferase RimO [Deltaproteobacteria bacterium]|nr:30S ribosomal protein S12 methylthiotransferase RimO [Deltaproteobacteria bacterium]